MSGWRGEGWQDAQPDSDAEEWARSYREAREQEALEAEEWADAHDEQEAEEAARRQRRRSRARRGLATVATLLLIMFFGFWYAYSYVRSDSAPSSAAPTASCASQPVAVTPADVTLNVYNATTRAGLAAVTAQKAAALGFVKGTVANDPLNKTIEAPAEVRFGPTGAAAGQLVAAVVGEGVVVVPDTREDASVDLVLGNTFSTLGPVPSPGGPVCPSPSASPSASASPS